MVGTRVQLFQFLNGHDTEHLNKLCANTRISYLLQSERQKIVYTKLQGEVNYEAQGELN